jgi:uncharacterized membrane protein
MLSWLRRSFIAGFFVTVPLFVTIAAFVWIFGIVDGLTSAFYEQRLGRQVPGLGILTTTIGVLLVGAIATNVIGRRILQRGDSYLLRVPVFRTIYAPVKQLIVAFSPDNEFGFKRVVLVTNHLYLGDIVICERARASFPDITVEEGLRIFLTGGMALPPRIRNTARDDRAPEFRV